MTPKFHPHVGHARLFVAMDVIRRYLQYRGYALEIRPELHRHRRKDHRSRSIAAPPPEAAAREYMDAYFAVMDRLNIRPRRRVPDRDRVHGADRRVHRRFGRKRTRLPGDTGDVYFDVSSFGDYGKLSHRDLNSQLVAARKELEPGKRDPRDFALWKRAREGEPSWPSPGAAVGPAGTSSARRWSAKRSAIRSTSTVAAPI